MASADPRPGLQNGSLKRFPSSRSACSTRQLFETTIIVRSWHTRPRFTVLLSDLDLMCISGQRFAVPCRLTCPTLWRRLLVRGDTSVARLHQILQVAFGWQDMHLHLFEIRGREYGVHQEGGVFFDTDAHEILIGHRTSQMVPVAWKRDPRGRNLVRPGRVSRRRARAGQASWAAAFGRAEET